MWKEIIEKKRWIIMVPIVMVILLLISLEVYVDIKSQKLRGFWHNGGSQTP